MQRGFLDVRDGVLDAAAEAVLGDHGALALRQFHSRLGGLLHAGALEGRNLQHGTAKLFGQAADVDLIPVFGHDVHHVNGDDHGNPKLRELCGQIQIAL